MLACPEGIDGAQLLWAISGCESTFGANCKPRHEPYYHNLAEAGTNAQLVALTAQFGCDAHSSFGPWQELLVNCTPDMKPENFADIDRAADQAVRFINRRILLLEKAQTIAQIATAYNSGKWKWMNVPAGVQRYAAQCDQFYKSIPMPAEG